MRSTLLIVVGVVLSVSFLAAAQSAPIPEDEMQRLWSRMVGTWELNLNKAAYTLAEPSKSWTVIYEKASDNSVRMIITMRRLSEQGHESISAILVFDKVTDTSP